MGLPQSIYKNLKKYFGYTTLRPGQKEILDHIFVDEDIIAILPTGSGKSLCYQLPATYFSGLVIVISPLIALMKDQVDTLQQKGIKASYINSSLGWSQQQKRLKEVSKGYYDILYIAPERFESELFLNTIKKVKVDLFAIDEAHCISEWGHDFRPNYLKLGQIRKELGNPRLVALTATATPEVREDIIAGLELEDFKLLVRGFERTNLDLEVRKVNYEEEKKEGLLKVLNQHSLPAIIYVGTRKRVEELISLLQDEFSVIGYHGGMDRRQRKRAQELFMTGKRDIVIATNAFGMGVDKGNIRLVIHYELPGTLEAYYQEAGRAGRDGFASKCILFYHQDDSSLREFLIASDYPESNLIKEVYNYLLIQNDTEVKLDLEELVLQLRFTSSQLALEAALRLLKKEGYIRRIKGRNKKVSYQILKSVNPDNLEIDYKRLYQLRDNKYYKLEEIKGYINTDKCRHEYILNYFGDEKGLNFCPGCDNCPKIDQQRAITKDIGILVQKILSCVIKLGGRFGITTVAKVLVGSESNKLLKRGLDKVSTYGIVKNYGQAEVIKAIKKLIKAGYLIKKKGRYPTVKITKAGYKILNQPYHLDCTLKLEKKQINNLTVNVRNKLLFRLKELRSKLAQSYSKPPFIIAHDRTLKELVVNLPQSKEEMLKITGIGDITYERYGNYFLKEIKCFLEEVPNLKGKTKDNISYLNSTYKKTLRLYQQGLSLEDIAIKRDLAISTIVDHLVKLIKEGIEIEINRFVSDKDQAKILEAIEHVGFQRLKPIKERVEDKIDYEQINLVVADYKFN